VLVPSFFFGPMLELAMLGVLLLSSNMMNFFIDGVACAVVWCDLFMLSMQHTRFFFFLVVVVIFLECNTCIT